MSLLPYSPCFTGVDQHLTAWILDFLLNLPQCVRIEECERDMYSIRPQQRTVLTPFLCTDFAADFNHNSANCLLQKLSDDSAIISLITDWDDWDCREMTQGLADKCQWKTPPD